MNVPNIADNPYVSLADLRDQNNGEEFLEKCVKNWNAWVEMTQNLNEVEERNNTLIVEQTNLAKQLDTSLRVNKDLQQQILIQMKDSQEKQMMIEKVSAEMEAQRMKLDKKNWWLTKISSGLVVAFSVLLITVIVLCIYFFY